MYAYALRSVLFAALATACGGETAPAPTTPTSEPAPSATGSAAPVDAVPSAPPPSGKRPPCKMGEDQACNQDPAVSALWGRCTEYGTCECKEGFVLNPWGKCQPK